MGAKKVEEGFAAPKTRRLRPPRPERCRQFARKEFALGLPEIVQRFVEEAQKGSIPHAKALISLAGLDKEDAVTARESKGGRRARSLSELLLRELRRPSAEKADEQRAACASWQDEEDGERDEGDGRGRG